MDTKDIITLGLGIGTILTSGVVSAVVTSWLNRKRNQFEFMRTKAEALYLAAEEYGRKLGMHTLPYYTLIKGECNWTQLQEIHATSGLNNTIHGGAETVTMLVEIYFPSVRPALAEVFSARTSFNAFAFELQRTYKAEGGLDPHVLISRMNKEAAAIDASIKALLSAIVEAARSYAGVKQQ